MDGPNGTIVWQGSLRARENIKTVSSIFERNNCRSLSDIPEPNEQHSFVTNSEFLEGWVFKISWLHYFIWNKEMDFHNPNEKQPTAVYFTLSTKSDWLYANHRGKPKSLVFLNTFSGIVD